MGDLGFGRHEHRRWGHRIGVRVELAVPDRGRDIDRPVAGAVDVGAAPALEGLIGADLIAEIVQFAVRRGQLVAEFAVEPLALEIAFVAGDPLVQPHMRRDDELRHAVLRSLRSHYSDPRLIAESFATGRGSRSGAVCARRSVTRHWTGCPQLVATGRNGKHKWTTRRRISHARRILRHGRRLRSRASGRYGWRASLPISASGSAMSALPG